MALNATNLKNDIITALEGDSNFSNNLSTDAPAHVAFLDILTDKILSHIVSNLEINGITVNLGNLLNTPTVPVPVPTDGGAAVTTTMIANTTGKIINQDNDGTGLVA